MTRHLAVVFLSLLFAVSAAAQNCSNPDDILLKNDTLPDVPSGLTAVSVISGVCPGEACGAVFDVTPGTAINQVAVGHFNEFGLGGSLALVNVVLYDGITWSGGIPTMGPVLFDLVGVAGAEAQISTHAINTVDLTPFGPITTTSNKLVVAFFMNFNLGAGNCATGYLDNFGTDNNIPPGGGGCTAGVQKNLIFITGQGWRDAGTATVTGIPICPIFYNGNWVIRACVTPALSLDFFPSNLHTPNIPMLVQFDATSANAGNIIIPVLSGDPNGTIPLAGSNPLPIGHDPLCSLFFNDPVFKSWFDLTPPSTNYFAVIPPTGVTTGIINFPVSLPFSVDMYIAYAVFDLVNFVFTGVSPRGQFTIVGP